MVENDYYSKTILNYNIYDELATYATSVDLLSIINLDTLLGVVFGGILAIVGSYWVSNKEYNRDRELNRAEEIYIPLYNELMKNRVEGMRSHKPFIAKPLQKEQRVAMYDKRMIYAEWNNIKHSARFYKTPKDIRCAMDALYSSITTYIDNFNIVYPKIQQDISAFFYNKTGTETHHRGNFGEMLLSSALSNDFERMDVIFFNLRGSTLIDENQIEIRSCIIKEISDRPDFIELKRLICVWEEKEQTAINCLEKRIEKIENQYK